MNGKVIKMGLQRWIVEFKGKTDDQGRSLFTKTTEKVAREQLNKVSDASDPPNMNLYTKVPPSKNSCHQLPQWRSWRPEAALEKFHEFLAHYGNTGMSHGLADMLTLRGTAEHNQKIRHRLQANKGALPMRLQFVPQHFEDVPLFPDHHHLEFINNMAACRNLLPVFNHVKKLPADNGERFLSE